MADTRRNFLKIASAGAVLGPTLPLTAAQAAGNADSGQLIYQNSFSSESDIKDWRVEGSAIIKAEDGLMVMENARPMEDGQAANFVHWCPEEFPADIEVSWKFRPVREPGLCILIFATKGIVNGALTSPFDARLAERHGLYDQYNNSDLEYLSMSYFRRRWESERGLHVVNLRYAPGFKLLQTGPDPIPCVHEGNPLHQLVLRKQGRRVTFTVDDLKLVDWTAPEDQPMPGSGHIGFRQMAPLKAEYADLQVRALQPA